MNFKALIGFLFLALGGYLWFGDPAKAAWPAMFGRTFHNGWVWLAEDASPYSIIICLVLAVACFMTIKKY